MSSRIPTPRFHALLAASLLLQALASPIQAQQTTRPPIIPIPSNRQAQQSNPMPPEISRAIEQTTATQQQNPPASQNNTAGEPRVSIQYPNNPISDVLDFYERLTGKRIIRDANLAGSNISIEVKESVPRSEAVELLEAVLLLNGYVFVDAGDNRVKIINSAGKNPRSEGITLYARESQLPEGEVVASYYMPLTYLAPEDAVPIFQQHVQLHPYGAIVPVPDAVVITENASVIRELIKLGELIDIPPARVETEFVQLHRADASKVAELVNQLLEERRENAGGARATNAPQRQNAQNAAQVIQAAAGNAAAANTGVQPQTATGLASVDAQILADERTNRVVIVAHPNKMDILKKLIMSFDEPTELMEPYEHQLSYISASETLPILVDLLAEEEDDRNADITEASQTGAGRNAGQTNRSRNTSGSFGGSGGGSSISAPDLLGEATRETTPESVTVGSTTLIADNRSNSIIVIGPPESREKVQELLGKLDKRPMQVYLSTVLGSLTLRDNQTTGIDIIQKFAEDGTHGVASSLITRNTPLLDPADLVAATEFPLTAGLTGYVVVDNILDVYVNFLSSTNDFKVLGRPTIFTQNNEKATILSGSRVAVPTQTLTDINNTTNTAVTSNIQYEDVVLKLEVIPLINSKREVTLQIAQLNDSIVGSQTISGNEVPTIGTQELTTTITVPNKSTIVLGGLITKSNTRDQEGVPWLSRIPLLGYLFRETSDTQERQELIVMIQPSVVETPTEMMEESYREQSLSEIGQDAARSEFIPLNDTYRAVPDPNAPIPAPNP